MTPEVSYPVDISEILVELGASIDVDAPYNLPEYNVGDETFTLVEPVSVDVTLSNTGSGIVATGTATARVNATCARCLCEFPLEVVADIEGFYVRPGEERELPEEQDVEFISENDTVDLAPALHAALVLETPFAPLHDEACAGICATCGADLNQGPCACEPAPPEGTQRPFAALKDLLGSAEGDSSEHSGD